MANQQKTKSSRIYDPVNYSSNFEGSAKEQGFQAIQPLDQSAAIEKRAQQKTENIKNLAEAARRQDQLNVTTLAGNQKIAQAKHQANWSTVKGILSLTETGLKAYSTVHEARETGKKNEALLNSIGYFEEVPEVSEDQKTANNNDEVKIQAESQGANETSKELIEEGGLNNKAASNNIQESTTYNLTKGIQGDVYNARAIHGAYLKEFFRSLPDNEKPRTLADAQALLRRANRQFLQETGLLDPRLKGLIIEELVPTMTNNTSNELTSLLTSGIEADQKANLSAAKSLISTLVDTDISIEDLWKKASTEYANGNLGFNGFSAASNEAALTQILEELSLDGHEGRAKIEALRKVLQRPGVKGTELEKTYEHLFDEYEGKADTIAARKWREKNQIEAGQLGTIVEDYYKDPTAGNKEKAILALQKLNTPKSIELANKLLATGLGYDPSKFIELRLEQSKGKELDETLLRTLLDEEVISEDEYKKLTSSGPFAQSKKDIKSILDNQGEAILSGLVQGVPKDSRTASFNLEASIRVIAVKDRVYNIVMDEVRVNPNLISDKDALARKINDVLKETLALPEFQATNSPKAETQWSFPSDYGSKKTKYDVVGKTGVQDFSGGSIEDLFGTNDLKGLMNPSKDHFFTVDGLQTQLERFRADGTFSDRLKKISKELGYTPKAFLNAQLRARGLPSLKDIKVNKGEDQTAVEPDIYGANNKFRYLTTELGLPWEGGAYLAANINAESGEVGDKGLIDWAPWHNTDARVVAIEKHFGKKVSEITPAEQLSYILVEMKQNNPEAYRIFMDPKSSRAALRKASYLYFGFEEPLPIINLEGEDISGIVNPNKRFVNAELLIKGGY
ncbi:virion structural protein [Cyanophage SS120-1]|uniref:Uncharacterized protein n=1 Tax=Cyanophage SS120-1 TaxID=616674 RepID=M1U3C1_9CAUD|nr:virion structural protein [Cyanophage SS120-1]AGG54533.1 hypothetical protein CYYG_00032 [Cyanophage SS120-1]